MKGFTVLFTESWHHASIAWSVYRTADVHGSPLVRGEAATPELALADALAACDRLPKADDGDVLAGLGEPVTRAETTVEG